MSAVKTVVFDEPRGVGPGPGPSGPRGHWTVSEVEEAMWRLRASGAVDDTRITFPHGPDGGSQVRADGIEASPLEVVDRRPAAAPAGDLPNWAFQAARVAGLAVALPLVLAAVLYVWGWALGPFF